MLSKDTKKTCVLLFLLSVIVAFTACGVRGEFFENKPPTVVVTSYSGWNNPGEADEVNPTPYEQTIYWHGHDEDGRVVGYAFRILNADRQPISTPGHDFIDKLGEVTSPDLINKFDKDGKPLGAGWVLHYAENADRTKSLDNPGEHRTILTDAVFTKINLPAADEYGNPQNVPSSFQIVAIDDKGAISEPVERFFVSRSIIPTLNITSSVGQLDDATIGTGVRVLFIHHSENLDFIIPTRPHYFNYWLYETRIPVGATIGGLTPPTNIAANRDTLSVWLTHHDLWDEYIERFTVSITNQYSTINEPKVDEILLTSATNPRLNVTMDENDTKLTYSVIKAEVVDLAGVRSKPSYVLFSVSDKYKPRAMFYPTHSYILGEHHWALRPERENLITPPSVITSEGTRIAGLFDTIPVINQNNVITDIKFGLVGDRATRFWFKWGYYGEYLFQNPNEEYRGTVLDDASGENYLSEIQAFHIQLNGKQFDFPPLIPIQDDPEWLRIPANNEIAQNLAISGLDPGDHVLSLKIEDLQGKYSDVVNLNFTIERPLTLSEKENKILFVCSLTDQAHSSQARSFYTDVLPSNYNLTHVNRQTLSDLLTGTGAYSSYALRDGDANNLTPYAFLNQFKYVICAVDGRNISNPLNINRDQNGLRMYMRNGGNVILVGNNNMKNIQDSMFFGSPMVRFYEEYFGWASPLLTHAVIDNPGPVVGRYYYFKGAIPQDTSFPEILAETNSANNTYDLIFNQNFQRNGIMTFSNFITVSSQAEVLYRMNTKSKDEDNWSPQQENGYWDCSPDHEHIRDCVYNMGENDYKESIVGFRKAYGEGYNYTFSFALTQMRIENVRQLFAEIIK